MDSVSRFTVRAIVCYTAVKSVWDKTQLELVFPHVRRAYKELGVETDRGVVPIEPLQMPDGTANTIHSQTTAVGCCWLLAIQNQHRDTSTGYRNKKCGSDCFQFASCNMDPRGTANAIQEVMTFDAEFPFDVTFNMGDGDRKWVTRVGQMKHDLKTTPEFTTE